MKKILVVDDDPHIQELSRMILQDRGYEVITAENGVQAIQRVRDEKPDLVLLDVMMPDMNGVDVCRTLKKMSPEVESMPIVMFTILDDVIDRKRAEDAGCNGYFLKPFRAEDLVAEVEKYLETK
jgi:two-component system alkaline phosphatase synthesis response regulator PhoP